MHDHSHHHHHVPSSIKTLKLAIAITFFFALVEAFAGWQSHSLALLSDAGHMVADALSLIMALVATWIASKPPSQKHSYGLGRAEVITALGSSLFIIFIVAGIFYEAIMRMRNPEHVHSITVMLVATLGLIVNIALAYIISRSEQTFNIRAAMLHIISDLLGSAAALGGGIVIFFTDWYIIDPLLSMIICVLILGSSFRLLKETFLVLMEGVPAHLDLNEIGQEMASVKNVNSVHDLHIWTLSSGQIVLTAHIMLDSYLLWEQVFTNLKSILHDNYHIEHITLQPEINLQIIKHIKVRPNL